MPDDDTAGGDIPKAPRISQMYRDVARLNERERELTGDMQRLQEDVDRLARARAAAAKPPARWWPDLDDNQTTEAWLALTAWMQDHLLPRFPAAEDVLKPCWYLHTDAVDALTSLYATWHAAYRSAGAEPTASAWWLHQWLPAAINQIRQALQSCDPNEHDEDRTRQDFRARLFAGLPAPGAAAAPPE